MKRIFLIWAAALLAVMGTASCESFFNPIPGEQYDLENTFTDRLKTEEFLNNVYSYVPDETNERSEAGIWTAGSLEADITWSGNFATDWALGTVYPSSSKINKWFIEYYKGISKASTFITNVDRCHEASVSDRRYWKAQARALRALYYFLIFRSYGPCILLGEEALPIDTPLADLLKERNTVDECIDFIVSEFDAAAAELPAQYSGSNLGRIDAATCKAYKAKALLYAASPLFNCNTMYAEVRNNDGRQLFPQDKSQEQLKWERAKEAYEEFLNLYGGQYSLQTVYVNGNSGQIDHYESFRQAASITDYASNTEQIFVRLSDHDLFSYQITPYHVNCQDGNMKGGLGFGTTQEIVDMYFTSKGLRIVDDPDYKEYDGIPSSEFYGSSSDYNDPFNPDRNFFKANTDKTLKQWQNREPRFYVCVTFNGSTWLKTDTNDGEVTTELSLNGNSGFAQANWDAPYTGYGERKMAPMTGRNTSKHCAVLMRLGDIYLGYAECLSACGDYSGAMEYVNRIRHRAGVPEYGTGTDSNGFARIAYTASRTEVDKRVHRERLIELSFEWNRFFDVRRWKVAGMSIGDDWYYPSYHRGGEGGEIHGLNYRQDPPAFFEKVVVESRAFDDRHYLFPIPEEDIRRNPKMVQNYGWSSSASDAE
ncbi:MAG: RagB/SusD family nutrient uptake outer membrane protein [Bacteroidales bacterium]|nr:RagB/SusD family nutrient uptake outer membrane protein [Bacteroidales bacterium]